MLPRRLPPDGGVCSRVCGFSTIEPTTTSRFQTLRAAIRKFRFSGGNRVPLGSFSYLSLLLDNRPSRDRYAEYVSPPQVRREDKYLVAGRGRSRKSSRLTAKRGCTRVLYEVFNTSRGNATSCKNFVSKCPLKCTIYLSVIVPQARVISFEKCRSKKDRLYHWLYILVQKYRHT